MLHDQIDNCSHYTSELEKINKEQLINIKKYEEDLRKFSLLNERMKELELKFDENQKIIKNLTNERDHARNQVEHLREQLGIKKNKTYVVFFINKFCFYSYRSTNQCQL